MPEGLIAKLHACYYSREFESCVKSLEHTCAD